MVSVDELKQKYAVMKVPPYGDCIIIPGEEFDPDWDVFLGDQGYNCYETILDEHPVTLVQLKHTRSIAAEKKDPAPAAAGATQKKRFVHGKTWEAPEDKLLIALWEVKPQLSFPKLTEKFRAQFPDRSPGSITNHVWSLQQAGKIKPRFTIKRAKPGKNTPVAKSEKNIEAPSKVEEVKPDLELALVNLTLETKAQIDSINEAYIELKNEFFGIKTGVSKLANAVVKLQAKVAELERALVEHKHADKTGEAMQPLEASN